MSTNVIGHTHLAKVTIPETKARLPTSDSTPTTPGHGHGARIVIPRTEARLPGADGTPVTPGHGHGGRFVEPPTEGVPTRPRPSARVARRSSLYSATDDIRDNDDDIETGGEHALFEAAHHGAMPPTMEAEEPSSAEVDGRFDQPAPGHDEEKTAAEEESPMSHDNA